MLLFRTDRIVPGSSTRQSHAPAQPRRPTEQGGGATLVSLHFVCCYLSCPLPPLLENMQAPNPDDPLNKEAAQMMQQSPAQFERLVAQSITRGCSIGGEFFPAARGERSG